MKLLLAPSEIDLHLNLNSSHFSSPSFFAFVFFFGEEAIFFVNFECGKIWDKRSLKVFCFCTFCLIFPALCAHRFIQEIFLNKLCKFSTLLRRFLFCFHVESSMATTKLVSMLKLASTWISSGWRFYRFQWIVFVYNALNGEYILISSRKMQDFPWKKTQQLARVLRGSLEDCVFLEKLFHDLRLRLLSPSPTKNCTKVYITSRQLSSFWYFEFFSHRNMRFLNNFSFKLCPRFIFCKTIVCDWENALFANLETSVCLANIETLCV